MKKFANRPAKAALLCLVIALGAVTLPASARVNVDINVGVPPPELRYEAVPEARHGYYWAPGSWRWDGGQHQWHEGVWVRQRTGYRYSPERWEQRGDRYHYRAARWDHDYRRSSRGHGYGHDHGDDRDQREHARGDAGRHDNR